MRTGRTVEPWERGLSTPGGWARLLALGAVAGGVVGFLGFLGGDLLICLFNWTGMMVIGAGIAGLLVPVIVRFLRSHGAPTGVALAAAILLAALPVSLAAAGFGRWAWPGEAARMPLADWYIKTALVEAMVVGLWLAIEARRRRSPLAPSIEPLRALANDGVICLQMEDHYVRVHRASGTTLELMSMTDAIARCAGPGVRTHRSWWVALSAVRTVERNGRNVRLKIEGGLLVPVARNRIAELRAIPEIGARL